jgi:LPS export ABC transporter protein LptC
VFYTITGAKNATLTSKRGTYNMRLGNMEAMGNVIVISEDGRKLTTEQLRFDPNKNEISSDSAFVATDPTGRRQSGIGFVTDPSLKVVRVMKASKTTGLRAAVPER